MSSITDNERSPIGLNIQSNALPIVEPCRPDVSNNSQTDIYEHEVEPAQCLSVLTSIVNSMEPNSGNYELMDIKDELVPFGSSHRTIKTIRFGSSSANSSPGPRFVCLEGSQGSSASFDSDVYTFRRYSAEQRNSKIRLQSHGTDSFRSSPTDVSHMSPHSDASHGLVSGISNVSTCSSFTRALVKVNTLFNNNLVLDDSADRTTEHTSFRASGSSNETIMSCGSQEDWRPVKVSRHEGSVSHNGFTPPAASEQPKFVFTAYDMIRVPSNNLNKEHAEVAAPLLPALPQPNTVADSPSPVDTSYYTSENDKTHVDVVTESIPPSIPESMDELSLVKTLMLPFSDFFIPPVFFTPTTSCLMPVTSTTTNSHTAPCHKPVLQDTPVCVHHHHQLDANVSPADLRMKNILLSVSPVFRCDGVNCHHVDMTLHAEHTVDGKVCGHTRLPVVDVDHPTVRLHVVELAKHMLDGRV